MLKQVVLAYFGAVVTQKMHKGFKMGCFGTKNRFQKAHN